MRRTDTLIIGGGQAGLAMSHCLGARGIDHVVIERGRAAERWRSERWDSLRLLTPNWQTRLPGFRYTGSNPDGYMTAGEVVEYFEAFARSFSPPLQTDTAVRSVALAGSCFTVQTDRDTWKARTVVIATGYCDTAAFPSWARLLPRDIVQVTPQNYRSPDQIPAGKVLIVGASASGVQIADELTDHGRHVTLAVGRHTRLPRMYRGRDVLWWLDAMGVFDETADQVFDINISRRQPSLQLVGRPDHATLDLPRLQQRGVRLTGHALGADGDRVFLGDDLIVQTVAADVRLARLLARIDRFITDSGLEGAAGPPTPFVPFCWPADHPPIIELRRERINSVVWATGYRRAYPWLHVPVLDGRGEIQNQAGLTPVRGLYVLGLQFQRARKSAFIDGVGADANVLAEDISGTLDLPCSAVA